MMEQRRAQLESVSIFYQVAGDGPPVVLVHGLAGSSRWWKRNVDHLAQSFQVYAIDLIGFGQSQCRDPFLLAEAATHLTTWMNSIGIARASIIGHSMGGYIAADLAAEYPERVDRLTLVNAAALPSNRSYPVLALGGSRNLSLDFLPVLVADAWRAGPATIWRTAQMLRTADLSPKLARIMAPTLVVCGKRDMLIPLTVGERLVQLIPDAELVIIPDAGHNAMWDRPHTFNQAIMAFLSAHRSNRGERTEESGTD